MKKGRVLIVDDGKLNRLLAKRYIEKLGHKVNEATDGIEALDVVRKFKPDLILLDLQMPNMNGMECLKRLKEDNLLRYIPVIICTNVKDADVIAECFENEASEFINKPIDFKILRAMVNSLIKLSNH